MIMYRVVQESCNKVKQIYASVTEIGLHRYLLKVSEIDVAEEKAWEHTRTDFDLTLLMFTMFYL